MSPSVIDPRSSSGRRFTAFAGFDRLSSGTLPDVAVAAARALADSARTDSEAPPSILVFDDGTGRPVDVDLRGSEEEIRTRAAAHEASAGGADAGGEGDAPPKPKRGRGRPRLGVVGKEVTLLPRHWAWLDAQQGGASATLRRLIDRARKEAEGQEEVRAARDAAYRFMAALGGDLPGYEEALRALFRGDAETFSRETHDWPPDVRDHAALLATTAFGRPVAAEGDR